ncbi:ephrin-B3-like isoform X2 [Scleropages formosus]|uniref:ephrin-B3-like isoform X2 n=1 Tax=Scleropages formosus TaxID=113540 RepID=UPI0008791983|nr:ephrin-B3-like isoform X2 [Scleropages formosus]
MGGDRRAPEGTMACRNGGVGVGILLLFLVDLLGISATNMEPIYWNFLMNKRFRDDKGYVLYPQIGDRLDLICPASDPAEYEYYKLYLVSSREQADRCEVTDPPNLLLTCDKPNSYMRFTIKFQEYSPNLWGHEFKTMHDYYIIATSDGTRQGLESMRGGVCATRGMKVVLKVGQSPYGLPPKPVKPDQNSGHPNARNPGHLLLRSWSGCLQVRSTNVLSGCRRAYRKNFCGMFLVSVCLRALLPSIQHITLAQERRHRSATLPSDRDLLDNMFKCQTGLGRHWSETL